VFLFETGDRKLLVSKEWQLENLNLSSSAEDNVFYVTVSIVESHGYESTPSTPLIVTLMSKTPTTAYTALAITAGIVFILAIIVLVIRWRHRRRYPKSRANNRYHTRSGSASVRLQS